MQGGEDGEEGRGVRNQIECPPQLGFSHQSCTQQIYILPWHINLSHSMRGTLGFNDCYGYETAEMNTVRMIDKVV